MYLNIITVGPQKILNLKHPLELKSLNLFWFEKM